MPKVVALYRYPVKGFTAESCDVLKVLDEGRIAGDRVLGIRFNNSLAADNVWGKKHEFVTLLNSPGLAYLKLQYDHQTYRLSIRSNSSTVLFNEILDDSGRKKFAFFIQNYVSALDDNLFSHHSERTPLKVVGDGVTSRFQDDEFGHITLHSRESLAAVAQAVAVSESNFNECRFRSNIAIEGLETWGELNWVGKKVCIGQVIFNVVKPKSRCLATHVNPSSGHRDLPILTALTRFKIQEKPTFAIAMVTHGGGEIHVGDQVNLLD